MFANSDTIVHRFMIDTERSQWCVGHSRISGGASWQDGRDLVHSVNARPLMEQCAYVKDDPNHDGQIKFLKSRVPGAKPAHE